jgi:hypothetical protein
MQNQLIARELTHYEYLRGQVQREFPDVDDETLSDTLAGITDLPEMIAAVLRSALQDLALARGLRGRLAEMQERLARLEDGAQKKRHLVTSVMERAEMPKLVEPDFTVTLRRTPPALRVVQEGRRAGRILEAAAAQARPPGGHDGAEGREARARRHAR